jgi:hypothetical protein
MLMFIPDPDASPDAQRAQLRWARRAQRRAVENIERNPWVHEYRRVRAEAERTGDETLYADFERRYLADLEARYPQAERRARAKRRPR